MPRLDSPAAERHPGDRIRISPADLKAAYRSLLKKQRRAFNLVLQNPGGVSWSDALRRAGEGTYRSLERLGLVSLLPPGSRPERVVAPLEYRFMLRIPDADQESLFSALLHCGKPTLQTMARAHGLPAAESWAENAAKVHERVLSVASRAFHGLSGPERALIETVVEEEETLSSRELAESCLQGRLPARWRLAGPQELASDPEAAKKHPLAALLQKGLLVSDEDGYLGQGSRGGEFSVFVPSDLRELIARLIDKVPRAAAAPREPAAWSSRREAFWIDLARLMVAVLSVRLDLTKKNLVSKPALKRLQRLLRMDPMAAAYGLDFLVYSGALALGSDALAPSPEALEDSGGLFGKSAASFRETVLQWPAWVDADGGGRQELLPAEEARPARLALIEALGSREGRWTSRKQLSDSLRKAKRAKVIFNELFFDPFQYWSRREAARAYEAYVERECRLLYHMGLAEADSGQVWLRPSASLAGFLGDRAPELPAGLLDRGAAAVVQPNLEVLAPLGLPLAVHRRLAAFGEIVSVQETSVYRFSAKSLYRGMSAGLDLGEFARSLAGLSKRPLPHAFEALFDELRSRAGEFHLIPCVLVARVRAPHLGKVLEKLSPGAVPLEGAPGYYRLGAETRASELSAKLQKRGYYPVLEPGPEPGAGPDGPDQPPEPFGRSWNAWLRRRVRRGR